MEISIASLKLRRSLRHFLLFRHPLFALYELTYQARRVIPYIMQVGQQQKEQREAQSPLSYEPTTSPSSDPEAQRGQQALGPSMQHQGSSSHSTEHARQHEPQGHPTSAPSQPDPPTLPLEHTDQLPSAETRRRLGDFLRLVWVDWLFLFLALVFCGILNYWVPMYRLNYRKIPLWYDPVKKTWYGPLSLSCPKNGWPDVITSTATAIVVVFVPLTVILCTSLLTKSFWDAYNAKIGLIKALVLMSVFRLPCTLIGSRHIFFPPILIVLILRDLDRFLADLHEGLSSKKYSSVSLANTAPTLWKRAYFRSPAPPSALHTALPGLR